MSNLLVIDFDFHFYNAMEAGDTGNKAYWLYDWGHSERSSMFLLPPVWASRAHGFVRFGLPIPTVTVPEGGWGAFWERFTFAEGAALTFADSNMHAGEIAPSDGSPWFDKIVLFDAHHDSGYGLKSINEFTRRGTYSCEDWMLNQQLRGTTDLEVRYPTWKPKGVEEELPKGSLTRLTVDDGEPVPTVFDAVFVCRSGAWVPPWADQEFLAFIEACPVDGEQIDDIDLDRGYTLAAAQRDAQAMQDLMEKNEASLSQN